MLKGVIGNANTAFNAVKTAVADKFNGVLKDDKRVFTQKVETKIKIMDDFFSDETTTKLDALIKNRRNLGEVINALKENLGKSQDVVYSYYENYEDIEGDKKEQKSLTSDEVKIKYDKQIDFCKQLFKDAETELQFIYKNITEINGIINNLLIINKNIVKPKTVDIIVDNAKGFLRQDDDIPPISVEQLTTLKGRLREYNTKLNKYLLPQCIEKLFGGGGSSKKTNKKKNILGRERCIYKKTGDRKEYVKYKGDLITVKEYKIIMRTVANHR